VAHLADLLMARFEGVGSENTIPRHSLRDERRSMQALLLKGWEIHSVGSGITLKVGLMFMLLISGHTIRAQNSSQFGAVRSCQRFRK
jgi:hypothetical protein